MSLSPPVATVPEPLRVATSRGRWVLLATVLGSSVAALDATVVGIALPAIGRDFRVGLASLQWVVTAYLLTLAGLLLVGGSLGDRFGRRRVFVVGVAWFAAASLLCGIAPSAAVLVAARALQGVGGALLTPGSLAILEASFAPADRARAIGAWSGLGGVATALGPFLGGWLIDAVSWRLVFFINLPLAAAVVVVAVRHVPESRDPQATGGVDVPGGLLAALGLGGLTYGLIEGPGRGFASPVVLGSLAVGVAALALLLLVESRVRAPMLPLSIFRSRQFGAANAVTFTVYAALGGALFLLPLELQTVAGYSPFAAGTALLPVTLLMLALSARSGALAARIGPKLQMTTGPLVVAAGMALLVRIDTAGAYLTQVLPAVTVLGLGLAITVAPLTSTVLAAAPAEHAGVSSAVNNDVARAASLLAVALLPAAAGISGASYLDPAGFDVGFGRAVLLAAALCAAGGVLAAATIRNPPRGRHGRGEEEPGPRRPADLHPATCTRPTCTARSTRLPCAAVATTGGNGP
ncbi:MAG TPA: MFS transporter [Frankiaceae bacterium]|nr:MFS transporter [Frankiaceae bacterium]